jgi:hypothetical protein
MKLKQHYDKQKLRLSPGAGAVVLGKEQPDVSTAPTSMQGGQAKKSYADVVLCKGNTVQSQQTLAGKCVAGELILEKRKEVGVQISMAGKNKGLNLVFVDVEKKEGISAFSEMLSAFKEDLNNCLERFEVGWSSSIAEVQRALREVHDGQPKPKPPVKHTYYRRKNATPNTH